jgi:2,4-dienoyl-CoA reductase-like NADH-dependent reductase (Old Yellow Enzyme family)
MAKQPNLSEGENARVRMTLDLSQRLNEEVERLAAERQISKADILRFAVEFLSAAERAKRQGMHVGAWIDEAGNRKEREFVGF